MMMTKLQTPIKQGEPADLYIFGDIVEDEWFENDVSPNGFLSDIREAGADKLNVHIDSYGGDLSAGLTIYNLLANSDLDVTTITDGFACSAASLIFMAGNHRVMRDSSLLMIHNAWQSATGNADELRKAADDLEKISGVAADIYKRHTMLTDDEVDELLEKESWITPAEALEWGFATVLEGEGTTGKAQFNARKSIQAALLAQQTPVESPQEETKPEEPTPETPMMKMFGAFRKEDA